MEAIGFLTGLKWEIASNNAADQKYVVCNADEGDPGAFMDRSILEGDPHSVLKSPWLSVDIASVLPKGWFTYGQNIRWGFIKRLKIAISQAVEYGLLGNNILGTGFDFEIKLRYGAGALYAARKLLWSIRWKENGVNLPINLLTRLWADTSKTNQCEQCGDTGQYTRYYPQRCRLVLVHRYRKVQRYQNCCTGRQN